MVVPPLDRRSSETPAQTTGVLEGNSASAEVRNLLDGQVERTEYGFAAATDERILFVPYAVTDDAAKALVAAKIHGLLASKLEKMPADKAHALYLTTLPPDLKEN